MSIVDCLYLIQLNDAIANLYEQLQNCEVYEYASISGKTKLWHKDNKVVASINPTVLILNVEIFKPIDYFQFKDKMAKHFGANEGYIANLMDAEQTIRTIKDSQAYNKKLRDS